MRPRTLTALAAVGLAVAVPIGTAAAAPKHPTSTKSHVVVTCINTTTGAMRVKPAKHSCRKDEVKRSWLDPSAVHRLIGAGTVTGATGPIGPAGANGTNGTNGANGTNGIDASAGPQCVWVASVLATAQSHSVCTNKDLLGLDLRRLGRYGDFTGSNLANANLAYPANLEFANLTNANLTGADFQLANLASANLTGANLTSAALLQALLYNANLTGADLTGADLTNADLTNANLTGVIWSNTTCPNGTVTNTGC